MKENKRKAVLMVVVLFFGMCISPSIMGLEETVLTLNNILYVGGSGSNNYSSIQAAIDDANNGDTVFVYDDSSPYYETVDVHKSINLIGENKDTTIIDGGGSSSNWSSDVVYIYADWVNFSGFTVRNDSSTLSRIEVISDYNNISGNIILGNRYRSTGIKVTSDYNSISENVILFCQKSIVLRTANNTIVYGNVISNGTGESDVSGIILRGGVCNNNISKNHISNIKGHAGLHINNHWNPSQPPTFNNTFYMNIVTNCSWGFVAPRADSTNIIGNIFSNNRISGIYLIEVNDFYISQNIISNSKEGIRLWSVTNVSIFENTIENCTIGIYITTEAGEILHQTETQDIPYNNIIQNNFRRNLFHSFFLFPSLNLFRSRWDRNYWGKARLLPKIILGFRTIEIGSRQIPVFPKFQFDMHPAQEPYDIPRVLL